MIAPDSTNLPPQTGGKSSSPEASPAGRCSCAAPEAPATAPHRSHGSAHAGSPAHRSQTSTRPAPHPCHHCIPQLVLPAATTLNSENVSAVWSTGPAWCTGLFEAYLPDEPRVPSRHLCPVVCTPDGQSQLPCEIIVGQGVAAWRWREGP